MKQVYLVKVNADLCEGRGPMVVRAICTDIPTAEKIALDMEPYGHKHQFTSVETMTLVASYEEYTAARKAEVRAKALAKLTKEEKLALEIE